MAAATRTGRNTLICFTNCKLALEDGSILPQDLWIDEETGVILDAQVSWRNFRLMSWSESVVESKEYGLKLDERIIPGGHEQR